MIFLGFVEIVFDGRYSFVWCLFGFLRVGKGYVPFSYVFGWDLVSVALQ